MEFDQKKALAVAAVSAAVVALCIITAIIWGELPSAAWLPFMIGVFGGGLTMVVALAMVVAKRVKA